MGKFVIFLFEKGVLLLITFYNPYFLIIFHFTFAPKETERKRESNN